MVQPGLEKEWFVGYIQTGPEAAIRLSTRRCREDQYFSGAHLLPFTSIQCADTGHVFKPDTLGIPDKTRAIHRDKGNVFDPHMPGSPPAASVAERHFTSPAKVVSGFRNQHPDHLRSPAALPFREAAARNQKSRAAESRLSVNGSRRTLREPYVGPFAPDDFCRRRSLITDTHYFGSSADIPDRAILFPTGLVPLALRPHLSMGLPLSVVAYISIVPC